MSHGLHIETMVVVGLYVLATAPFLPLMLVVHGLRGAYTGLFVAALVLQLIPIGLVFLPLGGVGVFILGYTLMQVQRRLRDFRRSGVDSPDVHKRWVAEYMANLVAFGFALEQKAIAALFLEVSSGGGLGHLWTLVLPLSALLWLALGLPLRREWRAWRSLNL